MQHIYDFSLGEDTWKRNVPRVRYSCEDTWMQGRRRLLFSHLHKSVSNILIWVSIIVSINSANSVPYSLLKTLITPKSSKISFILPLRTFIIFLHEDICAFVESDMLRARLSTRSNVILIVFRWIFHRKCLSNTLILLTVPPTKVIKSSSSHCPFKWNSSIRIVFHRELSFLAFLLFTMRRNRSFHSFLSETFSNRIPQMSTILHYNLVHSNSVRELFFGFSWKAVCFPIYI